MHHTLLEAEHNKNAEHGEAVGRAGSYLCFLSAKLKPAIQGIFAEVIATIGKLDAT